MKKTSFIHLSWICFLHKNRDISINSKAMETKINALQRSSCRGSNAGPFPCKGNVITTTLHEPWCSGSDMPNYIAKLTRSEGGRSPGVMRWGAQEAITIDRISKETSMDSFESASSIDSSQLTPFVSSHDMQHIRWLRHSLPPLQVHVSSTSMLLFPSSL
jgi:hypothetical protein